MLLLITKVKYYLFLYKTDSQSPNPNFRGGAFYKFSSRHSALFAVISRKRIRHSIETVVIQ